MHYGHPLRIALRFFFCALQKKHPIVRTAPASGMGDECWVFIIAALQRDLFFLVTLTHTHTRPAHSRIHISVTG